MKRKERKKKEKKKKQKEPRGWLLLQNIGVFILNPVIQLLLSATNL
jgi:hypothetical protein